MKAAVLDGVDQPLVLRETPDPVPNEGEALIRLRAAALNRRDLWIRKGQYAGLKFPIILGSDGVGSVIEVSGVSSGDWVGKDVIINPSLHWGQHESHQDARGFEILGLPTDGTFAELVRVPIENLISRPQQYSDEEAAAIPLAGVTAYRAVISRGGIQSGETILVTGVGSGAATFALQIAVAAGGRVYVTSSSADKVRQAVAMGAVGGELYTEGGWDDRLKTQSRGFDLIVDSAGGSEFSKLIDLANPGGRIVFFGATAGTPPSLDSRKVFWKQLSLLGTTMGSPADFRAMIGFFAEHRIRPKIDAVYPLAQADQAVDSLQSASRMGKVVLRIS